MSLARLTAATIAFAALASATPIVSRQIGPQSGEGTYYDVGLGSCGIQNSASEYVVAVSQQLFDTYPGAGANPNLNPICGKQASVSYGGKSITVTIVDRCTGCAYGDLDFSTSAFAAIADMNAGRIQGIQWQLVGDGGSAPAPAPAPAPPAQEGGSSSGSGCGVTVNAGDSCWAISQAHGISLDDFFSKNPSISADCSSLQVGQQVCV
ncbi:hypothetical protein AURDEDRAFT_110058 [Auricularia subglabra TFB-10046 SS5]|nr:hypothetical protein AURDEDRAFT_110058 [Auricularia subglabra TFB-10046 SS5]